MDWVQDMTARWVRIMSTAGGDGTPLDEAVRQISEIGGSPGRKGRPGRLKRNAAASAEASAVTVLCSQLIAGVLVSDLMIDQLGAPAGQTREQFLEQLTAGLPQQLRDPQLRALRAELSASCRTRNARPTQGWAPASSNCSGSPRIRPPRLSGAGTASAPRSP